MARRPDGPLRRGWTTGACATAAAKAAYEALLTGRFPDPVEITLPAGQRVGFTLARERRGEGWAEAGVIKDAGDDPDVTHNALVLSRVSEDTTGTGVTFRAGEGVGTVTRAGLAIPPGEPAINPVPRQMITQAIAETAAAHDGGGDVEVTVSIPDGAALARRTLNGRLGIVGGLSILGTTGIVIPYSCSSWIHSIHRGIDVARAAGLDHLAAATGTTSEQAVRQLHGLPEAALLDMGDFAGGTLKYLRDHPVARLSIAGGFGKLSKLAAGHLDLHSGKSQVDLAGLADIAGDIGGNAELRTTIAAANTANEALELARQDGLPLADAVAARARATALATLAGGIAVEVLVVDRGGGIAGRAGF